MLKLVNESKAKKTRGIAVTYRAGSGARACFATCPETCELLPSGYERAKAFDRKYFEAEMYSVPRRGVAFSYSHWPVEIWGREYLKQKKRKGDRVTTINFSADTIQDAEKALALGVPVVMARPAKDTKKKEVLRIAGAETRLVQCPATYLSVSCRECGGGLPLCARAERDYIIVFPAHGIKKKAVGSKEDGGCYGEGGRVRIHWDATARSKSSETLSEPDRLKGWAEDLPRGTILRHRVVGDLGK
jgi:hypothetical protein